MGVKKKKTTSLTDFTKTVKTRKKKEDYLKCHTQGGQRGWGGQDRNHGTAVSLEERF